MTLGEFISFWNKLVLLILDVVRFELFSVVKYDSLFSEQVKYVRPLSEIIYTPSVTKEKYVKEAKIVSRSVGELGVRQRTKKKFVNVSTYLSNRRPVTLAQIFKKLREY